MIFTEEEPEEEKSAVDLPDKLPGINLQDGLMRLMGNAELYLDLLFRFMRDYANAHDILSDLLEKDQNEDAAAFAHKLCGVANNLGIDDVGRISREIESDLRENRAVSPEKMEELMESMGTVKSSYKSSKGLM